MVGTKPSIRDIPSTHVKWDLKNADTKRRWKCALRDLVDHNTCQGFFQSEPPSISDLVASDGPETRKAKLESATSLEEIQKHAKEWSDHDRVAYSITYASIEVSKSQHKYIEDHFMEHSLGNQLIAWVLSHV